MDKASLHSLLRKLIRADPTPLVARDPYQHILVDALENFKAGCDFQMLSSTLRIFAAQQTREGASRLTRALCYAGVGDAAPVVIALLGLDEDRLCVSNFFLDESPQCARA